MLSYKTRNKLGQLVFHFWKTVAPSLRERYQEFDTKMFLKNEMDPRFPWKQYADKRNMYFKKWGFEVSQLDAEYYSRVSGIIADYYVTRSMAVHYIYPYLDRYDLVSAYMDKNCQKLLLGLPDEKISVLTTEDIIFNSNGVFYDGNRREYTYEEAIETLLSYGEDMILKPSVETYGGRGVMKVCGTIERSNLELLIKQYRYNFAFQRIVNQHPTLALFNASSVNTIRIVTYRDFNRKRKVLYSCIRFGGEGSVMDNVCSGGGYTGIDINTGLLKDRKRYSYFVMDAPQLDNNVPNEIPSWERIKNCALELHGRLPQMDLIGWDFSVSPNGTPILIEFNPRPGVGLQQAVGPMFCKRDLDEIMEHISKCSVEYTPLGVIKFADRPDFKTVHFKFNGN